MPGRCPCAAGPVVRAPPAGSFQLRAQRGRFLAAIRRRRDAAAPRWWARAAEAAAPTASGVASRSVSIDATTTRASTVIRSIPTSDTRTQASMTMPLSRTRSRTSMRLVPPASSFDGHREDSLVGCQSLPVADRRRRGAPRQRRDPPFEQPELLTKLEVLLQHLLAARAR